MTAILSRPQYVNNLDISVDASRPHSTARRQNTTSFRTYFRRTIIFFLNLISFWRNATDYIEMCCEISQN